MPLISIIIPVYNTCNYIEKCLNSLLNQKYKNIEIIIVNDGSEDNSENVILEWIKKHKEIQVQYFKKSNGGLSDARNFGVEKAKGEYICFVDSDDYLDEELFLNLKKYMKDNIDLIKFKFSTVNEKTNEIVKHDGPIFDKINGYDAFNVLSVNDTYMQPAVLYLYKRSFWMKYDFKYPVGRYHEDFALTPLIIINAKTVISTDVYGYYYVQSQKSITRGNDETKKMNRAMDLIYHYDNMCSIISDKNINSKIAINLKRYYTNCIILKVQELSTENKKIYINEIRKRNMYRNIKISNFKQLIKRILLCINIELYLKLR